MLSNLFFSLNATVPIFIIIIIGYILMQVGFFNREFTHVADKYVFKIALPALLFRDIATADIHTEFDIKFVIFCMISTTIIFLGLWLGAKIFLKDATMVGAFTQASARGSAAILGIAFIQNIYGQTGLGPLMIISAVPLFNIFSVIILTAGSSNKIGQEGNIKAAFINVVKNPIIISIFVGIPFAIWSIEIPGIPLKAIDYMAQTASPIALLVVGASFEGSKALAKIKPSLVATFIKLIGLPMVFLPIALWLGFREASLVAIIVMLASPTTVACYIMAKNMGNDEVLTSSIVVMSTLLSSVTLTLWIYIMRTFAWI